MSSIFFVSNSRTSLPLMNDFDGGEAGGITGHDNLQMSNADALRVQSSLFDAIKAGWKMDAMSPDKLSNFEIQPLMTSLDEARAQALEAAAEIANASSIWGCFQQVPVGGRDDALTPGGQPQDDQSSREQLALQPERTANSSSLSRSLASASCRSEPAKHL